MTQRIVAFEPSADYRSVIGCLLDEGEGYALQVHDAHDAFVDAVRSDNCDLIIVSFADLPDPEQDLAHLRRLGDTPILAFVQDSTETKAALRSGADYDLRKPFDLEVFTVAVDAVLRRGGAGTSALSLLPAPDPIRVQDLRVFPDRRTVERDGRRHVLSQTEWQLFAFLLRHPDRVFTRRELAAGSWGPGYASRNGQAELYVSRVRRKVEREAQRPRIIETVRGEGYRLVSDSDPRRGYAARVENAS